MFNIIDDLFGPKPKFFTESKKDSNGNVYILTTNQNTLELRGKEIIKGVKSGAIIQSDSRTLKIKDELGANWRKNLNSSTSRIWKNNGILDQGQIGMCVMASNIGRYNAAPGIKNLDIEYAKNLYWEGCEMEGHQDQDNGLYSITGAKLMRKHNLVSKFYDLGYRVENPTDGLNILISWLHAGRGPLEFATIWRRDMSYLDNRNFLKFSGPIVGGHAFVILGVVFTSKNNGYFVAMNSWGYNWGDNGIFYIDFNTMRKVLSWGSDIYAFDEIGVQKKPVPVG